MAQEPQAEPKRVRVFGPDNRYYSFPEGTTKEAAVSFFKKKGVTSPEAPAPKPAKVTAPAAPTPQPVKQAPEESSAFGRGIEKSFGLDPQKMIEAYKGKDIQGVGGQPRRVSGAQAQWAEMGEEVVDGL